MKLTLHQVSTEQFNKAAAEAKQDTRSDKGSVTGEAWGIIEREHEATLEGAERVSGEAEPKGDCMIIASRKDEMGTQLLNQIAAADKRIAELEARLKEAEAIPSGDGVTDGIIVKLTRAHAEAEGDIEELAICEDCGESDTKLKENNCWPPRYCHSCRHKLVRQICEIRDRAEKAEADAGRLRAASQNLVDAVARARQADDNVDRDPSDENFHEQEDAHASLIIFENAALAALRPAEAEESEGK